MINPGEAAEIVGEEHVHSGADAARYAVNGVTPTVVAAPGTREEAAALIRRARERGWALVAYGGGTQIDTGFPPGKLDLVLSTRRLNRVVDYQPDDMTVTVEPGVTLANLEETLAGRSQFLPLDPPLPQAATVGGTVAAAASGPWRAGFGTPRDWVIGCRVVGADGQEVRGGGQVVKNVAGYDLPKLYTGSYGTLGLLTEVTFKVMPRPPASAVCRVTRLTAPMVEALVARVLHSDLQPTAVELAHDALPFMAAPETGPPDANDAAPWRLYFQFMHVQEAVDWQVRQLTSLAMELGGEVERLIPPAEEAELQLFRDAPASAPFVVRLGTISSGVAVVATRVADLCRRRETVPRITAHAATGQVHLYGDDATPAFAADVRALSRELGISCTFARLPPECVGQVDPWDEPRPEIGLT
ncbi:MAG TPA: FAD-binding oxidoreductase, partial [Armatimonadota bacterium]|nr:FAD-binding oxidoreductase [Armatimonadota bacterium]